MKNRIDVVLVTAGMIMGFSVILMHLIGIRPCNIINKLDRLFSINNSNLTSSSTTAVVAGWWTFQNFIDEIHYLLTNLFRCK